MREWRRERPRFRSTQTKNMKYADRIRGAALVVLTTLALTGCAGRWFEQRPQGNSAEAPTASSGDLKSSMVTYIQGMCALPREQREPQVRELNEALLPNHATISCGRGGGGGPQGQ
jgi:hypothetical protein